MRKPTDEDVYKYAHYLWWRFGDGSLLIPPRSMEYFLGMARGAITQEFLTYLHEEGAVAA